MSLHRKRIQIIYACKIRKFSLAEKLCCEWIEQKPLASIKPIPVSRSMPQPLYRKIKIINRGF